MSPDTCLSLKYMFCRMWWLWEIIFFQLKMLFLSDIIYIFIPFELFSVPSLIGLLVNSLTHIQWCCILPRYRTKPVQIKFDYLLSTSTLGGKITYSPSGKHIKLHYLIFLYRRITALRHWTVVKAPWAFRGVRTTAVILRSPPTPTCHPQLGSAGLMPSTRCATSSTR